jgi:GNAT superfamily N-acetyltransferase
MILKRFTEEVDNYTVLLLNLDDYRPTARTQPASFEFLDPAFCDLVRDQEKCMLQQIFEDWNIPFCRKLRGWRPDSPVFVMKGDHLVGGVYVCDKNEFDADPFRGQLHYFFVHPAYRACGIHSANVRQAIRRARAWGLREVYVNTDRYLVPEVYIRWGAKPLRQIQKSSRLPYNTAGNTVRKLLSQTRRLTGSWRNPCD